MFGGLSREVIPKEFEFWRNLEVDFMMISPAWDFFLKDENIARVEKLNADFGLNILIHS